MSGSFDQRRAGNAIYAIGKRVMADGKYARRAWRGIALVIDIGERQGMSGFVYDADGWEAQAPADLGVIREARSLAKAMALGGASHGRLWVRCLLHVTRKDGDASELKVAFDYSGGDDWTVTAENVAEMADKLRPPAL